MSIAPWILLAVLVCTLIGDSVLLAVASYRRRRFRKRWAGPPATSASLGAVSGRVYNEQRLRDIVDRPSPLAPMLRADQRRSR